MGCPYHYRGSPPTLKDFGCATIFIPLFILILNISTDLPALLTFLLIIVAWALSVFLVFKLPGIIKDSWNDYQTRRKIPKSQKQIQKQYLIEIEKEKKEIEAKKKKWIKDLRSKWENDFKNIAYWSKMPIKKRKKRFEGLIAEAGKWYIDVGEEKATLKWNNYPEFEANMNSNDIINPHK